MKKIKSICVFCGSSKNIGSEHRRITKKIGTLFAKKKIKVIFGGGRCGLCGDLADSVLEAKGEIVGIMPRFLEKLELVHPRLTKLILVKSLQERKEKMIESSDGFLILPGGIGTMDELLEVLTWKTLGLLNKPVVLLNSKNFWEPFLTTHSHLIKKKYSKSSTKTLYTAVKNPKLLLEKFGIF